MKGDVINGISFLAILPWYFYLAFKSLWEHVELHNLPSTHNVNPADDQNDNDLAVIKIYSNEELNENPSFDFPRSLTALEEILETTLATNVQPNSLSLYSDEHSAQIADLPSPQLTSIQMQFLICILFTITVTLCFFSWKKECRYWSSVSFVFSTLTVFAMNMSQWPHRGEKIIVPQFFWHLLIITGNFALPLSYKIALSLQNLGIAIMVVLFEQLYSYDIQLATLLCGATFFFIILHIGFSLDQSEFFSLKNDTFRTVIARFLLAIVFAYHTYNEVINMLRQPGYANTGGFSILRAGFFASFGLFAAGEFKTELDAKEVLEKLVQERTHQIQQQANRLRMVEMALEASETAIAITDHLFNIVWYNTALKRLCSSSSKEIVNFLGSNILDVLRTSESDCEKIKQCFNLQKSIEAEVTVNEATIHIQVGPFLDDHFNLSKYDTNGFRESKLDSSKMTGSGSRFVVVLKDFTEKRKLEIAEKTAEREILLKQAMSESCQILSHELRTPLQGIMGITSMLLDEHDLSNDTSEALSLVMVSSRLLLTLINNMLDVRKCDANMMGEFELTPTELLPPVQDAVNFCRPFAAVSSVHLNLVPLSCNKESTAIVLSDPLRLQQIVINLVSNAIKHSLPGCSIRICMRVSTLQVAEYEIKNSVRSGLHQDAWDSLYNENKNAMKVVIVSVSDAGNGIDVTQANRLFQKFAQLSEHSSGSVSGNQVGQPSGTGLGLNLCLKFIHRMKGNIWASNNIDQPGACFSFYLPLLTGGDEVNPSSNDSEQLTTMIPKSSSESTLVSSIASRCKVLVVDDTPINLKVLKRMLERVGVHDVVCVDSGHSAILALSKEVFSLVITDIQMPGMSGTELSEQIRSNCDISPKPPVVGLTAEVSKAMDEKCAKSGLVTVLHKPLTASELRDFFDSFVSQLLDKE